MQGQTHKPWLPELRQLEALIDDGGDHVRAQVLAQVPWGHDGVTLPVYGLSMGGTDPSLPVVAFVAGVHGLERIGTQVLLSFMESLISRLNWDDTLSQTLSRVRLELIPLLNPVGMARGSRSNGNGVDLMRNAPQDCSENALFLVGGHRFGPRLPWYRGPLGAPMEPEAQALCNRVQSNWLQAPFVLSLDLHSGFGREDRIWFPYARSRLHQVHHLGEIFHLRELLFQTYRHQNYLFEPQSCHYLCHGDLWDYLYDGSLGSGRIFLPLTLEMGSWRWVRKAPLQLRYALGLYHPMKPHRVQRTLRAHLVLMEFLINATVSWQRWIDDCHSLSMAQRAREKWYGGGA